MKKKLILLAVISLILCSCSKEHILSELQYQSGEATINGKVFRDYLTLRESVLNAFWSTPLRGNGDFQISKGGVAYLQFVLRDASANSASESWVILLGIPLPDGETFPLTGKEYRIESSSLTNRTYSGGGNFYDMEILEQMKESESEELPAGIGGLEMPYDYYFISLHGMVKFTDSVLGDNGLTTYYGIYHLENEPDEEYDYVDIEGKFNLVLTVL